MKINDYMIAILMFPVMGGLLIGCFLVSSWVEHSLGLHGKVMDAAFGVVSLVLVGVVMFALTMLLHKISDRK